MSSEQSVGHCSLAVSAGGHSSGCAFRKKWLMHLSMAGRSLGNRDSFFSRRQRWPNQHEGSCCLCNKVLLTYKDWKGKQTKIKTPQEIQMNNGRIFFFYINIFHGVGKAMTKCSTNILIPSLTNLSCSSTEILETRNTEYPQPTRQSHHKELVKQQQGSS